LPRRAARLRSALLAAAAVAALAIPAAGCGTGGLPSADANTSRGRQLFVESCAQCHTLADAGAQGKIGPDLDETFKPLREQDFRTSGIRALVADQIKYPLPPEASPDVPAMPRNLVDGEDVDAVAAYVADVAGKEVQGDGGAQITATDGEEIFAQAGCGSCHALSDAGSTGTIGPDLNESRPSIDLAVDRVTNGRGAMPSFRDRLNTEQIRAVAVYVARAASQ
jgi:cbb3-type cytochrome c oxidase subunit III